MHNLWNLLYLVIFIMVVLFLFRVMFGGGIRFGDINTDNLNPPRIEMVQTIEELS